MLRRLTVLAAGMLLSFSVLVNPVSAADPTAADLAIDWQKMNITEPGVYKNGAYTYIFVSRPWSYGMREQHKSWARAEIGRRLYMAVMTDSMQSMTTAEKAALAAHGGRVWASGSTVVSTKEGESFKQVFATKTANIAKLRKDNKPVNVFAKTAAELLREPAGLLTFYHALGSSELELVTLLRNYQGDVFSVTDAPTDLRKFADRAPLFYKTRDSLIRAQIPGNQSLLKSALNCTYASGGFPEVLRKSGLRLHEIYWKTPILKQVEACQGFAVFDKKLSDEAPPQMHFVKEQFALGKNLSVATTLLEHAAEVAPRSPIVWEYLTAAYEAAGNNDAARICARTWFILTGAPDAFKTILSKADGKNEASLSAFLEKYR